jgi:hypothetical protein
MGIYRRMASLEHEETSMIDPNVRVMTPYETTPEFKRAVGDELGLLPIFVGPRRGVTDNVFFVLVLATLTPLWAGMAEAWGAEAAKSLGRVVQRLRHGDAGQPARTVELVDASGSDVGFVIDGKAADDTGALQALMDVDTSVYRPGTRLRWNPARQSWSPRRVQSPQ